MRRLLSLSFLLSTLLLPGNLKPPSQPALQGATDPEVEAILASMEPEERVGQLFMVTYYGADTGPESDIARLISEYHVGGVVLLQANDNFTTREPIPQQVYSLTTRLQQLAGVPSLTDIAAAQPEVTSVPGIGEATATPDLRATADYIPLFIAAEQEGSAWPYTSMLSGLTEMPSSMAIGATWNTDYAESAGRVAGQELSAMGINMLLGPSADVVETPQPYASGDLGTRVFGGEPVWVSDMTAAYVRGAHEGSIGRLAVVPRHFPGYGGADRLASDEIPTVRRSRDQLRQTDLLPFFAVTGGAEDELSVADGLLVGHIRYQGFQGDNLRTTTKPFSFDPVALPSVMSMDGIASWRENNGLLMTDSLGLRGVRRYYAQADGTFPARSIAREAFGAGNDLLYLGNFGSNPPVDQTATIIDTIDYFVQQYEADQAFRAQVDASVRRILRQKLDLYDDFTLSDVLPSEDGLTGIGTGADLTFNIARSALTLLEPAQPDVLASPERGDHIVIFTDTRTARQCSTCDEQPLIAVDALRSSVLRLYGPYATGLVSGADITQFSFQELSDYIEFGPQLSQNENGATETVDLLGSALANADWVVFLMLDIDEGVPGSNAVSQFLSESPANPGAQIVVFAMGAPYYLDSTEISKLTAYYALYGYTSPFVDVAARALYQEIAPSGAPPVSVPAIDYDILAATEPDPTQVISLSYAIAGEESDEETEGISPPTTATINDTLVLRTGIIQDKNGHPVPDGTPVEFVLDYASEGLRSTQSLTSGGTAEALVVVEGPGELRISAVSGDARNSEIVYLVVSETGSAEIDVLPPDITPTPSPTPSPTPTEPATEVILPTPAPQPTPTPEPPVDSVNFGDLFLSLIGLLGIGTAVMLYGMTRHDLNYGLLLALPTVVFGLLSYNYYALMLPGSSSWRNIAGRGWGAGLATWIGALLGLGLTYFAVYAWNRWVVMALRNRQRG